MGDGKNKVLVTDSSQYYFVHPNPTMVQHLESFYVFFAPLGLLKIIEKERQSDMVICFFFYFVYPVFIAIVPLRKSLHWNLKNFLLLVMFKFTGNSNSNKQPT
jgi:uncharacterized membrane protein